jgi:hypothetical protein
MYFVPREARTPKEATMSLAGVLECLGGSLDRADRTARPILAGKPREVLAARPHHRQRLQDRSGRDGGRGRWR